MWRTVSEWPTVSFCRCAKVTYRVILLLRQSDPPCQSDAPCRFVAVPKWRTVSFCRCAKVTYRVILSPCQSDPPCQTDAPCHFVAVSFWPAPKVQKYWRESWRKKLLMASNISTLLMIAEINTGFINWSTFQDFPFSCSKVLVFNF